MGSSPPDNNCERVFHGSLRDGGVIQFLHPRPLPMYAHLKVMQLSMGPQEPPRAHRKSPGGLPSGQFFIPDPFSTVPEPEKRSPDADSDEKPRTTIISKMHHFCRSYPQILGSTMPARGPQAVESWSSVCAKPSGIHRRQGSHRGPSGSGVRRQRRPGIHGRRESTVGGQAYESTGGHAPTEKRDKRDQWGGKP